MKKGIIIALDLKAQRAKALVRKIGPAADFYKVPPAMVMESPDLVPWLLKSRKKVFLDCKWHDIPSQVKRSVEAAGRMGVTSVTIHAGAGRAIMKAALSARPRPLVWGVTVLTSLGGRDLREVGVAAPPARQVLRLAKLAQSAGLDGLVCSPQEVALLRKNGIKMALITPGIQFGGLVGKDQTRVSTPDAAWRAGADCLVVGRSVLEARDPAAAVRNILSLRKKT